MRTLWRDLVYGLRVLRASPALSAVAVLTLALGIAANTTVFSWVEGLLLHPYPGAADSGRLAVLEMVTAGAPNGATQSSYPDYRDYRDHLTTLAGLTVHREDVFSLGDIGSAQAVWGELVSGNYFQVLGVTAELGRTFTPEEAGDKPGAYPVAVISDRLWRTRYHADPRMIGKTIRANRRELVLIGVAPPEFRGTMPGLAYDIWVPNTMGPDLGMIELGAFESRVRRNLHVLARLKPGVSIEQAAAEAAQYAAGLAAAYPKSNQYVSATVVPPWRFSSAAPELFLRPLEILMAASVVVLLIVCANVANLLLARSLARRKELSIRLAMGASRGRLIRQLLTETLLLAGLGALVGMPLAFWMEDLFPALLPKIDITPASGFYMDGRILAFTTVTCILTALLSGAAPALFSLRSEVNEALKEGGRTGHSGTHSRRIRRLLVVSEVAMATVALIGAGLFLRSFQNARTIHPGFDMNNVFLLRFYMGSTGYTPEQTQQFCTRLRDRLLTVPGVTDAAYADYVLVGSGAGPYKTIEAEGYDRALNESTQINETLVSPGYFGLLHIPLLDGRDFRETDTRGSEPVIIVNQSFARKYFRGANPVGRKVRCWNQWATVIGLAKDTRYFTIADPSRPYFFAPFRQRWSPSQDLFVHVRTAGDPAPVMAAMRAQVAAVDPKAAFYPMLFRDWAEVRLLPQRFAASMVGALGLISLVLAAIGLYSVMAYTITERTQEIGIRMALGAGTSHVLGAVFRQGAVMIGSGLAVGLAVAWSAAVVLGHASTGILVNVSAADPLTFGAAAGFLALVGLAACYLPARRASKIDPNTALRWE